MACSSMEAIQVEIVIVKSLQLNNLMSKVYAQSLLHRSRLDSARWN